VADRDPRDIERIAELERKVEELSQLVLALQEQLRRNSGNSNRPPSSDSPGERQQRHGKAKSGRKRGGQPGHSGSSRALLPPQRVSEFVHLFPPECASCWRALPRVPDARAQRFQTMELPPLQPHTTEYVRHAVVCPCCHYKTWGPVDSLPASPIGPRLSSVVALLTGVYHLSRRSAARLLSDVVGVQLSLGAISAIEARVSEALEAPVAEVWQHVEQAPVKHTDGTTWFEGGLMRSLWTIATAMASVFKIVANGKADTLRPLFGARRGILVSDRATALGFWAMERRQVCWAHLLRKFISFSERAGPAGALGRELLDYLAILFTYWGDFRAGRLSRQGLREAMAPVRPQVEAVLRRAAAAGLSQVSGSCADILEHQAALWTFVECEGVEPTNNHAERELRAFVLWRRRSFGTQSERGNRFAEALMTVAHTARKQDRNVLAFLTACCTAAREGTTPPSLLAPAAT
jgi:transposase